MNGPLKVGQTFVGRGFLETNNFFKNGFEHYRTLNYLLYLTLNKSK